MSANFDLFDKTANHADQWNESGQMAQGSVSLRPLELPDVNERYVAWLNDPLVNRFLETRRTTQTLNSVQQFVTDKLQTDNEYLLAIEWSDHDCPHKIHVGNIKLGPLDHFHLHGDISLFIGEREHWGKGIAGKAIGQVLELAFTVIGLRKVCAGIYQSNIASQKTFFRSGFLLEGVLREHVRYEGHWQDVYLLGLTRERYQKLQYS